MADNVMPNKIRINNDEEFSPRSTGVYDDDTGEMVPGVMKVVITLSRDDMRYDVTHTLHWPTTPVDYVVNLPEDELEGKVIVDGVLCKVTHYWLNMFVGTAMLLSAEQE